VALDSTTYEQLQGSFASLRMTGLEVSSHVQSSGLSSPHPLFFPLPRPAWEGEGGEGCTQHPSRLAGPWATLYRPPWRADFCHELGLQGTSATSAPAPARTRSVRLGMPAVKDKNRAAGSGPRPRVSSGRHNGGWWDLRSGRRGTCRSCGPGR